MFFDKLNIVKKPNKLNIQIKIIDVINHTGELIKSEVNTKCVPNLLSKIEPATKNQKMRNEEIDIKIKVFLKSHKYSFFV